MKWENLREEEFAPMLEKTHRVCAVGIGCIEKHGQHLPLGADTMQVRKIVSLAAEREPVCEFPALFFGDLQGAHQFDPVHGKGHYGFVAFSAELLLQILHELCDEIGRNGFDKIVFVNGHGGNQAMLSNFVRAMRYEKKPYKVFSCFNKLVTPPILLDMIAKNGRESLPLLTDEDVAILQEYVDQGGYGGHACFSESGMMLGTEPEFVRMDRCDVDSGLTTHRADFLVEAGIDYGSWWNLNYPNSFHGTSPRKLTQTIADTMVSVAVDNLAKKFAVLRDDEKMAALDH